MKAPFKFADLNDIKNNIKNRKTTTRERNTKRINSKISYGFTPVNKGLLKKKFTFIQASSQINKNVVSKTSKFERMTNMRKILGYQGGVKNESTYKKVYMVNETRMKSPSLMDIDLPSRKKAKQISFHQFTEESPSKSQTSIKRTRFAEDNVVSIQSGTEEGTSEENEISKSFHQNAKKWKSFHGMRDKNKTSEFTQKPMTNKELENDSSLCSSGSEIDIYTNKMIFESGLMPIFSKPTK